MKGEGTKPVSMGKCNICHMTFSKAAMTRHLKSCIERKIAAKRPSSKQQWQKAKVFHLVVEGRDLPQYWMHLEAPANATLKELDNFLRDTWLECCGHLSMFTLEETNYMVEEDEFDETKLMDVPLGKVLSPGIKFYHEYDFGTTTELTLRVVSEREGEVKDMAIQLLAQNEPPAIICESCEKIATKVCGQCIWSGEGWLCNKCARKHECGEEMLLPVVNSPRVGMCAYEG